MRGGVVLPSTLPELVCGLSSRKTTDKQIVGYVRVTISDGGGGGANHNRCERSRTTAPPPRRLALTAIMGKARSKYYMAMVSFVNAHIYARRQRTKAPKRFCEICAGARIYHPRRAVAYRLNNPGILQRQWKEGWSRPPGTLWWRGLSSPFILLPDFRPDASHCRTRHTSPPWAVQRKRKRETAVC